MENDNRENSISEVKSHEIEVYTQAHETRRKWESYIWQYGMIVLALIGFITGQIGSDSSDYLKNIGILEKGILTLLTIFLLSTFLNVYRARILMKNIEKTINNIHRDWDINYNTVPCEIDKVIPCKCHKISSTFVAILSHFLLLVFSFAVTVFVWFF